MQLWRILVVFGLALPLGGCSSEDPAPDAPEKKCKTDEDCAGEAPICDVGLGHCSALPPGHELGTGDGSPGSVALVTVYEPDKPRQPTDLAFNPSLTSELWVVNRLDDSAIIIENTGTEAQTSERRHDPAAPHFMAKPPALSFGAVSPEWGQTFAVCGDDDNGNNGLADFMGPALFTANLDIFAKQTDKGLGSHLDMLHSTSFCRGIEHVDANVYFAFNSDKGSLDRYDFHQDHGPGNDDHSDGEIFRWVPGLVAGVDGIPSHLAYSPDDHLLYVADTGNKRIAKLDTASGTVGASFPGEEALPARNMMDNAVIVDLVPAGTLEAPSGIELHGGLVFVSDDLTSRFYAFTKSGELVRQLETGLPPGSLAGFTFGPDGKIYFVDMISGRVYRIDPL